MEFIDILAPIVQKYAPNYGVKVCSPIIAQACLETGYGIAEKAQVKVSNNNLFGLKYRENRVTCHSHFFTDGGWEVEKGQITYLDSNTLWYGFASVEDCVKGYFEFTATNNYNPLRNAKTKEEYCNALVSCGYATDTEYATKLLSIIEKNDLTKYDNVKEIEVKKKMRINVHAGHNPDNMVACGAIGLLKESTEARLVKDEVIRQLKVLGHTTYDCTVNDGTSQSDVLKKIVSKCNSNDVDLDVSIHLNVFNEKANGTETYIYSESSQSSVYAMQINGALVDLGFTDRGVKINTSLYVLRNTKAPALLVECCFIDNAKDVELYNYKSIASAIVKGITGEIAKDVVTENDDTMVETETNNDNTTVQELYRVQVGAYGVKANAENMLAKLKKSGFDGFITN